MSRRTARHKTKAAPKAKVTHRWPRKRKVFADKITFNPRGTGDGRPPGAEGELVDEDRTGRFIGRFQGAGQPPLPKR